MTKKAKRCLVFCGGGLAVAVAVVLVVPWTARHRQYLARKDWKERALPEIARLADDRQWVSQEIALISTPQPAKSQRILAEGWLTDRMILMKDGEWLVYQSHCGKEPPHHIRDIFLAKGSNGRWYYSTCHFCLGMLVLVMTQDYRQPLDVETFAKVYHLSEFDGKSDECLKETETFPDSQELEKAHKAAEAGASPRPAAP